MRLIVAPCSMKTLSGIVIVPPIPAFYSAPKTVDELVNNSIGRVLDLFEFESKPVRRWQGARR